VEGQLLENDMFETIVYPNPTEKEFTIVVNSESNSAITAAMYDMTGKKIMDMNDIQENVPYTVSQQLATGMYLIKIEQNGFSQSVRLIKE
jgi:Secretion system C-terminal sorting domain